jgi:hypothetical protein
MPFPFEHLSFESVVMAEMVLIVRMVEMVESIKEKQTVEAVVGSDRNQRIRWGQFLILDYRFSGCSGMPLKLFISPPFFINKPLGVGWGHPVLMHFTDLLDLKTALKDGYGLLPYFAGCLRGSWASSLV